RGFSRARGQRPKTASAGRSPDRRRGGKRSGRCLGRSRRATTKRARCKSQSDPPCAPFVFRPFDLFHSDEHDRNRASPSGPLDGPKFKMRPKSVPSVKRLPEGHNKARHRLAFTDTSRHDLPPRKQALGVLSPIGNKKL